jgi:phospholipid-binding lipoprotein MlaA
MRSIRISSLCSLLAGCLIFTAASAAEKSAGAIERESEESGVFDDEGEFYDPFAEEAHGGKPYVVADPLERLNRAFFTFNDRLYVWVLKPTATAYGKVAPEPFRESVRNFFTNLQFPIRAINNLLQGKAKGAGVETARFLVNSTVGIGGLFDPALDEWELQPYPEDFDQTLGFYRVPPGIYLHWPVVGPSSVRGTVGSVGDTFMTPWPYVEIRLVERVGWRAYDAVNATSLQLGEYESFKRATLDPYVALRSAYFERRQRMVER